MRAEVLQRLEEIIEITQTCLLVGVISAAGTIVVLVIIFMLLLRRKTD